MASTRHYHVREVSHLIPCRHFLLYSFVKNRAQQEFPYSFPSSNHCLFSPMHPRKFLINRSSFSLAQICCLGAVAILGGLSAFLMIILLCIPLTSSSYCISAARMFHHLFIEDTLPWNHGSSSLLPTCASEKNCFNSTTSVTIISVHLQHAHFMVDLIEGSGLPPGAFFDADGSYVVFSSVTHDRDLDGPITTIACILMPQALDFSPQSIMPGSKTARRNSLPIFKHFANFDTRYEVNMKSSSPTRSWSISRR